MIEKHRAFVIDVTTTGEKDMLITLLTEKSGRVMTIAKSGRISRKRFSGALDQGVHMVASLRRGRNYTILEGADVVEYNENLREDPQRATILLSSCEVMKLILPAEKRESKAFIEFENFLKCLKKKSDTSLLFTFMARVLKHLGYLGVEEKCPVCKRPMNGPLIFKPRELALVCASHRGEGVHISREASKVLKGEKLSLDTGPKRELLLFFILFFEKSLHLVPNSLLFLRETGKI